jgi:UDP-2,4-diacetamido-2,4,6-trideoxy-beta-L-altropyranose hydrolase
VLFRCDASARIGTGHVMRCLTLAGTLRSRGWAAAIVGHLPPGLVVMARGSGVEVAELPEGLAIDAEPGFLVDTGLTRRADVIVTDHYQVTADWHRAVARQPVLLMAIDDLARQRQEADLLLNQNLGATAERYCGLVPPHCRILVGPRYALLRPEFGEKRSHQQTRSGAVERILVFLSGADEHDVTRRAAEAALVAGVPVDVVVGSAYPFGPELERWAGTRPRVRLHRNTSGMSDLMAAADLAISAPSSASWERCTLGLPTILVTLADNQIEVAALLADTGAAVSLGGHSGVTAEQLEGAVRDACSDPGRLRAMGRAAASITDGKGAQRVADALEALVDTRVRPVSDGGDA